MERPSVPRGDCRPQAVSNIAMVNVLDSIKKSLAGKLIVALGLLIFVGGGISWYWLISQNQKNLMANAVEYTSSYSDLVKKSVNYNMLVFNRIPIQHTIESIALSRRIGRIRIFDSRGVVFYSSQRKAIGTLVDRTSFACVGCHSNPQKPAETLKGRRQWITYTGRDGHRTLTYVDPIYNEPACFTAACHVHTREQKVLGVLESDFSLFALDEQIRGQTVDMTVYAISLMLISSLIIYLVLLKFVLKPVSTLSDGMKKVSAGDLEQKVALNSEDEMGVLAGTFNMMTRDLEVARDRMENWTQTLAAEVAKKVAELKKSQDKLIQAEKLASLGRLTADVAHEIRNPLTAVGGFAHRLYKIAEGEKQKDYAEVIITEVDRLEKILRDVLTFSRDARFHFYRQPLEETVGAVVKVYEGILKERSINLVVDIGDNLPAVLIDKDQVKQALTNLLANAIDAMHNGGTLTIRANQEELNNVTYATLKTSDTGPGIPEEKLPFIFEPFFSTKEIHGTGLGLSITRKIIEEHGGFIRAESVEGKGATIGLYFPYQKEKDSVQTNCWEYMQCGRDKDSALKCPAYPNFGRTCWAVAGTFCEGKVQGTFAQKYENCKKCDFYQKLINDEA
jgi:two-component system NtrC family sensor kinase